MQTNNKLREAMMQIYDRVNSLDENCGVDPVEIRDIARAALAEPVKNYEVGTAEEQSKRLHDYCKSHRCLNCSSGNGDECKFYRPGMKTDCKIEWANAPYESEASARAVVGACVKQQEAERKCVALREALKQVNELNDLWFDTFTLPDGATSIHDEIEDVISAALAATEKEGGAM